MVEPLRHRQTKEAATAMFSLQPPHHIPTLPTPPEPLALQARVVVGRLPIFLYPVHLITRNSFGLMTRKLSVIESQRSAQFRGTLSRRKLSVASANWAQVA